MVTAKMLSGGPLRKKVLRRLTGALTWIKGLRSSHDKDGGHQGTAVTSVIIAKETRFRT